MPIRPARFQRDSSTQDDLTPSSGGCADIPPVSRDTLRTNYENKKIDVWDFFSRIFLQCHADILRKILAQPNYVDKIKDIAILV